MQGHIEIWFGLLGLNASTTAWVISRFGLLGLNASVTARVISRFGLLGLDASFLGIAPNLRHRGSLGAPSICHTLTFFL